MGRHAYLILAHKNLEQLQTLVEMLDYARNDIIIHADAKWDIDPAKMAATAKNARVEVLERRHDIRWGGVSMMRAEVDLLKRALEMGEHDYYHLLSGQDLPIKSQEYIHGFFDRNKGKEFINLWQFKPTTWSRFERYTVFPEGEGRFPTRIINHIFKGLQMAVGYKINRGVDFMFGAQWFSITHKFAQYVVDNEPWLESVFKHTSTCDEIFLPTLLKRSPFYANLYEPHIVASQKEVNMSNVRFIDWTRGESIRHPWTFVEADFELLKSVPHLFARKFDTARDSKIVELLNKHISDKK